LNVDSALLAIQGLTQNLKEGFGNPAGADVYSRYDDYIQDIVGRVNRATGIR
jgi:hypothetical protein